MGGRLHRPFDPHREGQGFLLANTPQTPFPREDMELGDTTVRPVASPASWESVVFPAQGFGNHVLAQGQLSSAEGERWREEGGKYTDFNIGKTFRHLCLANIMNNLSHSMFGYMLNACSRYNRG